MSLFFCLSRKANLTATALTDIEAKKRFRSGLFEDTVLKSYTEQYKESEPYKHAVINDLIEDGLLRKVRSEIRDNVSFTPKETDIYKIHQSGDLANLDGLDDSSLSRLPSLLALRDAMYSETFRSYVSNLTGCGPLSARKTDLAINVYTPGCYLLCHDDVIGSRRVSYILYLTDPDDPWQPEWGGALRLYPTKERKDADGSTAKTPTPDAIKVIPPQWNQLSFFAVQPGESFHDVEEVYHPDPSNPTKDGNRIRMAVSGWFHIPQIGEDGYIKGEEERLAKNSGLAQLSGNPDQYDSPRAQPVAVEKPINTLAGLEWREADLEFLIKYMNPKYLTPQTLEEVTAYFAENSSISLPELLHPTFATKVKEYIADQENQKLPGTSFDIAAKTPWKVAAPPHKHRYLFQRPGAAKDDSPVRELLDVFLPSPQFRLWLQIATRYSIQSQDIIARRFRRGEDYTLATGFEGSLRLEVNLGLTPTPGWGEEEEEAPTAEAEDAASDTPAPANGKSKAPESSDEEGDEDEEIPADDSLTPGTSFNSSSVDNTAEKQPAKDDEEVQEDGVGGVEVYMAEDNDDEEDAAVYRSSGDDENILFFQAAAFNKMTIVTRDQGCLRFVKYVSKRAKGDRWDVAASFDVEELDEDKEGEGAGDSGFVEGPPLGESELEDFEGFSDTDSDSE